MKIAIIQQGLAVKELRIKILNFLMKHCMDNKNRHKIKII